MMTTVTLLLICLLFSKALALTCQQCVPSLAGTCNTNQTTCPDQCLTTTASLDLSSIGGTTANFSQRTCSVAGLCSSGSMNLGTVKVTYNSKCCSTDLCNNETLPALPQQANNGRTCYSCDANGCSATVSCTGSEDRCISASFQQGDINLSVKGCVSNNLCSVIGSTNITEIGVSSVQCCEGNLCNAAESFTLSFLLMIVPLLASILFS